MKKLNDFVYIKDSKSYVKLEKIFDLLQKENDLIIKQNSFIIDLLSDLNSTISVMESNFYKNYKLDSPKITRKLRSKIFFRDKFKCCICNKNFKEVPLTIDHIVPISKGGSNSIDNLQSVCASCNSKKGDK